MNPGADVNKSRSTAMDLFRYLVSGGMAAAAHFATLIVLVEAFGMPPIYASGLGFCVAVAFNYTLQYHWTFAASSPHSTIFARYLLVTSLMLLLNTALFWFFNGVLAMAYLLAQLCATALVVAVNFQINRRYTFH